MTSANSGANSGLIPPKRSRGNPNLKKGGPSLNPSGKPKPVDQLELEALRTRVAELETRELARKSAEADSAPGVVTAARMRKVLGQDPVLDCGPTEQRLREWLSKDVAKYDAHARELEAKENASAAIKADYVRLEQEIAELRKQMAPEDSPKEDKGSARAMALIDRILEDLDQEAIEEQRRFLKDGVCVACGNKPIPGQGEAGRRIILTPSQIESAASNQPGGMSG